GTAPTDTSMGPRAAPNRSGPRRIRIGATIKAAAPAEPRPPCPIPRTEPFVRRLRVGILDLVTNQVPLRSMYGRVMNASLSNIMPQIVAVWCEQAGHDVTFVCYTGSEDLLAELPSDLDIMFIGAFTETPQLAYALSNIFRQRGIVRVL